MAARALLHRVVARWLVRVCIPPAVAMVLAIGLICVAPACTI
eukprot:CAMPEP_0179143422 /NCGR_PEP_ID=MMETSP0796-20121207/68994_1 /TAXON_ID=73915 /ORGANISM="Pyrodinium bahamense, Strain pbaha01" /LENGTH=41 /DNA_ID= /DNA_START= /DNA_END= /DNA_ORIENTATION=